ncbi:MAG: S-layer homology domain-containing protein [Phascolarctobacterium sp.]
MKKSLVLAMAMALGVTASAYAANPFSDVPAGHWAYDSISKLAAAGVIDGYADATFGGDKLMTRYEMAQIVAKAMAKGANVDKLAAEFADELDNLGVRVANLEKKADNVKITGETRLRYWSYDGDYKETETTQLRSRIWITGQVNEDWTATAMLENIQDLSHSDSGEEDTKMQRVYVDGRVGGVKVRGGRYHFTDFNQGGMIYDTRMDGIQASYGKDIKLTVGGGKAADATGLWVKDSTLPAGGKWSDESVAEDMYYAELSGKISMVDAKVGYYKFSDVTRLGGEDDEIWAIGAGLNVAKDLYLSGAYYLSDYDENDADDDGFIVGVQYRGAKTSKPGTWGLWAKYYDMGAGTYIAPTFEADYKSFKNEGFEGYGVGADYTIAKNMVMQVKWYDLESNDGEKEQDTLYAQLNVSF